MIRLGIVVPTFLVLVLVEFPGRMVSIFSLN